MKFRVSADVGYVMGHLRYRHLERVFEVESEEQLKEMMKDPDFKYNLKLVIDDYEVDDFGDIGKLEYEEIKED